MVPSPRSRARALRPSPSPELPASYVHRPRIDALLDTVTQRPLALIVAPAGSGKTVAVAGWAASHPEIDVRWLAGADGPQSAAELTRMLSGTTPSSQRVLVLDDAHLVPTAASHLFNELRDADTDAPRLLLLAHHDPDWIPVDLRLSGQLTVHGYADLRFRPDEARNLVRSHQPHTGEPQLDTILDLGRGWAAGLVLMAQSVPAQQSPQNLTQVATRPLLDYMTSKVLLDLPPELRKVLTSVCDEPFVLAEEAEILSGTPGVADLLADSAAEGFLLEEDEPRRDVDGGPVWRIHPVLLEAIRRRTTPQGVDRRTVVEAHRRASEHHGQTGDPRSALRHAMLTGVLWDQLTALRTYAVDLLARGEAREVAVALDLIPTTVRKGLVQTLTLDALLFRSLGRYDEAKTLADASLTTALDESGPPSSQARFRNLDAELAILDVWQARCGWRHPAAARARAAEVLACSSDGSGPSLDHSHDTRGISPLHSAWLMMDLGCLELYTDNVDSAAVHIAGAEAYSRGSDHRLLLCSALSMHAALQMAQGSYQTAGHTADSCLDGLADTGLAGPTTAARAHLIRGLSRFHALDLDGAAEDLAAASTEAEDPFAPLNPVYRRILAADLMIARGDVPAAQQLLADEGTASGLLPGFAVRLLSKARMWAAAWMADVPAIEAEAGVLRRAGYSVDATHAHGIAVGLSGDVDGAIALYDQFLAADLPASSQQPLSGPAANASASIAVARLAFLLRAGTPEALNRARHLLPDALNRLSSQHLLWLAATGQMLSPQFGELLGFEASRVGGHQLAETAVEALRRHPTEPRIFGTRPAASSAHEAAATIGLTRRELDVLRALCVGGSNAAIASMLYVSENTVKTHLAALYRKLGVDSRTDAIAAARRQSLV